LNSEAGREYPTLTAPLAARPWFGHVHSFSEIAVNLGVAVATIWIGGAAVIGGFDWLRAHLRRGHPASLVRQLSGLHPGPARDL